MEIKTYDFNNIMILCLQRISELVNRMCGVIIVYEDFLPSRVWLFNLVLNTRPIYNQGSWKLFNKLLLDNVIKMKSILTSYQESNA